MIDLYFFYSAKMAIVFILMLLSVATLEAQRNEKDKFFDLMTAIGEDFGGEFNDAEKALELDLNGANSFLEELYRFATREIIRKNKNGQFECKKSENPDFKMAIKAILGKNVRNLLKAIIVPKQSVKMPSGSVDSVKLSDAELFTIKTIFDDKLDKKGEDLVNQLFAPKKKSDEMPSGSVDSVKFSDAELFNLLFSLGARLEALVHGKNCDGTLQEKEENSKDKIQTFLAVPKCFILPEEELSIFDYWIEIIEMKTKNGQKPSFGVAIYKEKTDKDKSEYSKEQTFRHSKEDYQILKQLDAQKFSIYESLNLLRAAFNRGYHSGIPRRKMPQIFENLISQIFSVFHFNWTRNEYWDKNKKYAYAMFFQNVSESFIKMMSDKGIDPELHLDSQDFKIREKVWEDVEENCKKFENEEAKIIFLNNVRYDLAINFEYNQRKDLYDRAEVLLSDWIGDYSPSNFYWILQFSVEESYLKKDAKFMLNKIKDFTSKTNRESISIIDALIGKEFNLGALFDQIKWLLKVAIPEEEANLEKAKKEIITKELENDINFLKYNPESIAEEKYQKAVAIICTIKEYGEKVEMLASKIKTIEIQKKMIELLSTIQNNEMEYFGPELLKQMKESCNQLNPKRIEMEENKTVSEEILLKNLQFEFYEIWKRRIDGGWKRIDYFLSIPLMQLKEQVRLLAKTFEKMLKNVKEHYAQKMDESNVGGDMIISE